MTSHGKHPANQLRLRAPVILLILAATAVPIELRQPHLSALDFGFELSDVLENIAGYVPLGIVLAEMGFCRGILWAALISLFAETSQFAMMHRTPQVIDVATNGAGAALGIFAATRYGIRASSLRLDRRVGLIAAALAIALPAGAWMRKGDPINTRGVTTAGTLEAHWKLDENDGPVALDSSGHGLHGSFRGKPAHVRGVMDGAVEFDGSKDSIDFGHSTALRLAGSMTISAWIRPSSFPKDDAAIVSQMSHDFGYQLDTTVDKGPRTVGFKLTNACGKLVARYGATPLVAGNWYHVAGVYDAALQTLDVYLNGKPDNGFLLGTVTSSQHSSRGNVFVGRRSDLKDFEFVGSMDDVRIYSSAITQDGIRAMMRGEAMREEFFVNNSSDPNRLNDSSTCMLSEPEDARIPGAIASVGVLTAAACIALWPSMGSPLPLVCSLAAGVVFLTVLQSTLPSWNLWVTPLVSLGGGLSVVLSRESKPRCSHSGCNKHTC